MITHTRMWWWGDFEQTNRLVKIVYNCIAIALVSAKIVNKNTPQNAIDEQYN